ncbi:MAG: hypothetical protein AAF211_10325 [Myxococcota bacterium]
MTRTMTLTLTSSLMVLATACGTTDVDSVNRGAPIADTPSVDDPADPEAPPASRSLSDEERNALGAILNGLPIDGDIELGGMNELGRVVLSFDNGPVAMTSGNNAITSTVMDGLAFQSLQTFGAQSFDFTVLVAFNGLDPVAQTVDELVFAFAPIVDPGTVAVAEVPDFDEAFGVYIDEPNDLTYFAQSGNFSIDAITLDPTTQFDPCAADGFNCPTVEGTFEGTLDVSALGFTGVGTISNTGLPAGSGIPIDITAVIDVPLGRTTFSN